MDITALEVAQAEVVDAGIAYKRLLTQRRRWTAGNHHHRVTDWTMSKAERRLRTAAMRACKLAGLDDYSNEGAAR